jgi:hypothetical protein
MHGNQRAEHDQLYVRHEKAMTALQAKQREEIAGAQRGASVRGGLR